MRQHAGTTIRAGHESVAITRPEKVLFPKDEITKADLAEYYRQIAPVMLSHLKGRPISMERYPDGIEREGFFQKKASDYYPDWIKTVSLPKQSGMVRYVVCEDAATLVYLANQAVITPHTWLSQADQPHNPDQMIFDLDPSNGEFKEICIAAKKLRSLLDARGLTAYVKTSGSRGLHILVPLVRRAGFDEVRAFAQQIAGELASADPKQLTTEVRKNKRRGRIFIDTARNAYAQTAVPAYAVRARDGAPVATPLEWDELDNPKVTADRFNIRSVLDRLKSTADPWKHLKRQKLAV